MTRLIKRWQRNPKYLSRKLLEILRNSSNHYYDTGRPQLARTYVIAADLLEAAGEASDD